jgi:endo-1,3(4)-beta-glucanase
MPYRRHLVKSQCTEQISHHLLLGFYNDQHFHYGYHIYAASMVAHFRPNWGKEHFEEVLLLVRSIANPSKLDDAFPLFRHKDWYQGSSWASGIPLPPLFGQIMSEIWHSAGETAKAATSLEIKKVGQLMTATELRSAKTYFHVRQNDESKRIYPKVYTANVVGILWQTMAQFGTWL